MKDLTLSQQYAHLRWTDRRVFIQAWQKCCIERLFRLRRCLETELGKADADSFSEFSLAPAESGTDGKDVEEKEETQIDRKKWLLF